MELPGEDRGSYPFLRSGNFERRNLMVSPKVPNIGVVSGLMTMIGLVNVHCPGPARRVTIRCASGGVHLRNVKRLFRRGEIGGLVDHSP